MCSSRVCVTRGNCGVFAPGLKRNLQIGNMCRGLPAGSANVMVHWSRQYNSIYRVSNAPFLDEGHLMYLLLDVDLQERVGHCTAKPHPQAVFIPIGIQHRPALPQENPNEPVCCTVYKQRERLYLCKCHCTEVPVCVSCKCEHLVHTKTFGVPSQRGCDGTKENKQGVSWSGGSS